jgi:hypothetical protein
MVISIALGLAVLEIKHELALVGKPEYALYERSGELSSSLRRAKSYLERRYVSP